MRVKPFQGPPAGPGLHIRLQLGSTFCRRWHRSLALGLKAGGHKVSIEWCGAGAMPLRALDLLRLVERTLYSSRTCREEDQATSLTEQDFASFEQAGEPDLLLNLTGLPAEDGTEIEVLEPWFDGRQDDNGIIGALLAGRSPVVEWRRLRDGAVLAGGVAAITSPHILTQVLSEAFALGTALVDRALVAARQPLIAGAAIATAWPAPSTADLIGFGARALSARIMARIENSLRQPKQWNIAWRPDVPGRGIVETATLDLAGFRWLPRDAARYFADPFPVHHEGRTYLFCEEFPYARGKGLLSVMEITPDGSHGAIRPVLETAEHLSYPCIFRHGGALWMIPESAAAGTLELYRAEEFPTRWVLHKTLMADCYFADATFFEHDGLCWIAATTPASGQSDRDTLSLFYCDRPDGDWTAHPMNPVVANVIGARPAGWLERCADGLRRPAQDCSGGYGWGLAIARIDRLTRDDYAETLLTRIHPPASIDADGLHSVNRGGGIEVIDAIVP